MELLKIENSPPILDEVYTAVEAARLWGLSDSTVATAIRKDLVPARKSVGTWLLAKSTMEAHWGPMPPQELLIRRVTMTEKQLVEFLEGNANIFVDLVSFDEKSGDFVLSASTTGGFQETFEGNTNTSLNSTVSAAVDFVNNHDRELE